MSTPKSIRRILQDNASTRDNAKHKPASQSLGCSREEMLSSLSLYSPHPEFILGLFHDIIFKLLSFMKVETLPVSVT